MARIAGISTEKDTNGKLMKVTFDLRKHGDVILPILLQMGALEEDSFEKEWEEAKKTGYTVDGLRQHMHQFIDKQWKKK